MRLLMKPTNVLITSEIYGFFAYSAKRLGIIPHYIIRVGGDRWAVHRTEGFIGGPIEASCDIFFSSILEEADALWAISNALKTCLEKKVSTPIFVIRYTGVDPEKFTPNKMNKGLSSKFVHPLFVTITNFNFYMKVRAILDLLPLMKELNLDFTWLIFGQPGKYEEMCRNEIMKNQLAGKVIMLGHIKEIDVYLASCDFYLHPTYFESLSRSILEAEASGRPVIASSIEGIPEIVEHGHTGFLAKTPAQIMKYIRLLSEDQELRERLGKNARELVKRNFTHRMAAEELARAMNSSM